jgi:hypothetical protein
LTLQPILHREIARLDASMYAEEFPYEVVRTNGGDEVLARAANLLIGKAAFETARRMYPRDLIEYRRGAQQKQGDFSEKQGGRIDDVPTITMRDQRLR